MRRLLACFLLSACAEPPKPGPPTDGVGVDDTAPPDSDTNSGDTAPDTGPDSSVDTAPDTSPDTADSAPDTAAPARVPLTGEQLLLDASVRFHGHTSDDRLGRDVGAAGDVNGDGCAGLLLGARTAGGVGFTYLACGVPSGTADAFTTATAIFLGVTINGNAGRSVGGGADFGGDGLPDVVIGAPEAVAGVAYVLEGPFSGYVSVDEAFLTLVGTGPDTVENVEVLGDVTGDGAPDLAVAGETGTEGREAGGVSLLSAAEGRTGEVLVDDLAVRLRGDGYAEHAGTTLSSGDLDGDGVDDLVIGGAAVDSSAHPGGVAWIVPGPVVGVTTLSDAGFEIDGAGSGGGTDMYAAALGDQDGDGYDDVGIGLSWMNDQAGAVYVVHGPPGDVLDVEDAATRLLGSPTDGHVYAATPLAPGDVDGDGHPDLAVGAPYTTGTVLAEDGSVVSHPARAGAALVVFGPLARGAHDLRDAGVTWRGVEANTGAAFALAAPGDLDGDGCAELLLGSSPSGDYTGYAWVVPGCGVE